MNERFDIDLRNRIYDVFENHEDLSADAGWDLLRQKYPEKKNDRGIIWWLSIAAVLLLFLGLFFIDDKKTQEVVTNSKLKTRTDVIAGNKLSQKPAPAVVSENDQALSTAKINRKNYAVQKTIRHSFTQHQIAIPENLARAEYTQPQTGAVIINPHQQIIASAKADPDIFTNNIATKPQHTDTAGIAKIFGKDNTAETNVIADPVLKMMAKDKARAGNAIKKAPSKTEGILSVSPYAATYFNYAKGSTNQVNVGAGVTTDLKLSGRLKLSTGIAIAQNTLSFDGNGVPLQAVNAALKYAAASNPAAAAPGNFPVTNLAGAATFGIYFNNYRADLIGLDVPVNLKYQVNNLLSVSGGFSSGTFINETYTTTFGSSGSNNSSTYNNSNHFGTFDLARTVNFSVGVGYPVGGNHIIVEPFLKYPIGGLGSQNIRFGASGINLKFNFGTQKK